MTWLERLRAGLRAPEDSGAGGGGGGGDGGSGGAAGDGKAADDKGAAAAAAAGEKKADEKKADAAPPERKSVLKPSGDADSKKDGEAGDRKPDEKKGHEKKDEPYEVKVPEGLQVDKAGLEKFTAFAKEKGLSAAHASEAIAFYAQMQKGQLEAWAKQGDTWYGELEKDAEFGGANLKASEAAVQSALKRFDPKGELAGDLEKHGIDNLPSLARFLSRVGRAAAEDKALVDDAKGDAPAAGSEFTRIYDHPDSAKYRGK